MKSALRCVSLGLALGAPALRAQGTVPGWFIESRLSYRVEGRAVAGPIPRETRNRTWRTAAALRSEGRLGASDSTDGTYTITRTDEKTTFVVAPKDRTIAVSTFDEARRMASEFGPRPDVARSAYRDLGDGGTILGHRTRRWESHVSYQAPAYRGARPGETQTRTITTTHWMATDTTDALVAAWIAMTKQVASDTGRHQLPLGFPMRTESRTEAPGFVSTMSTAVLIWRREPVDTVLFALPVGWRRVQMAEVVRNRRAVDAERLSAMRATAAARRATLDELNRLRGSTSPKDKARFQQLMDSTLKAMKPDSARLDSLIRANGQRIVDSSAVKKKP